MSFRVGLALGGGAARGLAHLGVLKALELNQIPVDIIAGTSIGAVIAAIYAANPEISATIRKIEEYINSPDFDKTRLDFIKEGNKEAKGFLDHLKKQIKTGLFFAVSLYRNSFISEESFRHNLEVVLPQQNIENCKLKLGLVSMNLKTGEENIFTQGDIIRKVMASCAIPGIFPPISEDDKQFVDGSWVNPVPADVARALGANFVIAVDVAPEMDEDIKKLTGFDVTLRAAEGSRIALKNKGLKQADITLVIDLNDIHWANFARFKECIAEGENVTKASIDEIKRKIFWKRLKSKIFL